MTKSSLSLKRKNLKPFLFISFLLICLGCNHAPKQKNTVPISKKEIPGAKGYTFTFSDISAKEFYSIQKNPDDPSDDFIPQDSGLQMIKNDSRFIRIADSFLIVTTANSIDTFRSSTCGQGFWMDTCWYRGKIKGTDYIIVTEALHEMMCTSTLVNLKNGSVEQASFSMSFSKDKKLLSTYQDFAIYPGAEFEFDVLSLKDGIFSKMFEKRFEDIAATDCRWQNNNTIYIKGYMGKEFKRDTIYKAIKISGPGF